MHLYDKSREFCIKERSSPAFMPFKGQVTEQTTVQNGLLMRLPSGLPELIRYWTKLIPIISLGLTSSWSYNSKMWTLIISLLKQLLVTWPNRFAHFKVKIKVVASNVFSVDGNKTRVSENVIYRAGPTLNPSCSCGDPRGHPCSNFTIFVHVSKSFQNYGGAKTIIKVSFTRTRMHSIGKL